ncbi:MAG: hypothetical protein ABIT83_17250 [Massilia sp.]
MHTPRRSLSKKAQLLTLTGLIAVTTTIFGCREQSAGPDRAPLSAPAQQGAIRSQAQAIDAVMALPEVKAASALIEQRSGGQQHGAVMAVGADQAELNGKRYWELDFVENGAERALRRAGFLVPAQDGELLVEDTASGQNVSLSQWRKNKGQL